MKYGEIIGDQLRFERLRRGMTQEDAAELAGVSVRAYRAWEAGIVPRRNNYLRLLAAFGMLGRSVGTSASVTS